MRSELHQTPFTKAKLHTQTALSIMPHPYRKPTPVVGAELLLLHRLLLRILQML